MEIFTVFGPICARIPRKQRKQPEVSGDHMRTGLFDGSCNEMRGTELGLTGGGNGTHQVYISGLTDHRLKDEAIVDHLVGLVEKKVAQIEGEKQREKETGLAAAQ